MNKVFNVSCPQCKIIFSYYQSEFRPFCSEKCKMIDLGHWFEESYKVLGSDASRDIQNDEQFQEEENGQEGID